ncbi:MAG TPA: YdeI/OmpD-associated family protein [Anaerolineaceae bacterium]|nr:YdeI/OmpD-associated family protein [Anaerolineaceae bacterium]
MEELYFESLTDWHAWLQENHDKSTGIWLVFYKKESGKPTLSYEEAVEEALCFGWIDSVIKKINEESYVRKFSPRKDGSNWSDLNKKRVEKLIQEGRMTEIGMAKIEIAKQNGEWNKQDSPRRQFVMPEEFKIALEKNKKAREFFNTLTKTDQKQFITWVATAKRVETREKRIKESLEILEKGQKLGLR